jgi:hypothetical protein
MLDLTINLVKCSSSDTSKAIPTLDYKSKGKTYKISKTFLTSELESTGFRHLAEISIPNKQGLGLLPYFNAVPHGGMTKLEIIKDFTNNPFVG